MSVLILHLQLPAHTTSTPTALRLRIFLYTKTATYEFRSKVQRASLYERHRDSVNDNIRRLDIWMCEQAEETH